MTAHEVCVMVSLFIVFLVITGGFIMYDEFRDLENYRCSLNSLVKETTPQGNSQYESSLKAEALVLLNKNAERVSNGTVTHLQGQKNHRSICIEYFTFGDYREKLMCTFENLVQQQHQEQ